MNFGIFVSKLLTAKAATVKTAVMVASVVAINAGVIITVKIVNESPQSVLGVDSVILPPELPSTETSTPSQGQPRQFMETIPSPIGTSEMPVGESSEATDPQNKQRKSTDSSDVDGVQSVGAEAGPRLKSTTIDRQGGGITPEVQIPRNQLARSTYTPP